MKNSYKILLIAVMLLLVVVALFACNDPEDPDVVTSLEAPQDIAANGSTISWKAVDGASSYEIIVDDGDAQTTENVFYQLDISTIGKYLIKVRAVGVNEQGTTIYSEYASFIFAKSNKLSKPIVTVNNGEKKAEWSAVTNASSYLVSVTNSSGEILFNEYQSALTFSFDDEKYESVGKYTIRVKAIPASTATEYANSDLSTPATYIVSTTLNTPAITSVNKTALTWTSISGSVQYKIIVHKVGDTSGKWPKTFYTAGNSYAFTKMGIQDVGQYYCLIQAIGDGEVYMNSAVSERDTARDLRVVDTIDYSSVNLTYNSGTKKWELSFSSENIDLLSDFVVSLETAKADNSSSMPGISKTINVSEGDMSYETATGDFDGTKTYYVERASGYVKNTEIYDSTKTYYTFDGVNYTEAAGIDRLDENTYYYLHYDSAYKTVALGNIDYVQVGENEAFNSRYTYYTRTGEGTGADPYVYTECVAVYDIVGEKSSLDPEDTTTVYLTYDGANYAIAGTYSSLSDGITYYVYKPFNPTTLGTTYFKEIHDAFDKAKYDLNEETYYVVSSASFKYDIDDLFFTKDSSDKYTYLKSDIAYYGKTYTISIKANGIKNNTLTGDDAACPGEYTSYRIPYKIDKTETYYASDIRGYFTTGTEEEKVAAYTKFVTKYDGYYAVESLGDLQYIEYAQDKNYVVMQDLDASGYYWKPISNFTGKFDGNNHKIENLVYASSVVLGSVNEYTQGLFAKVSGATIENLYLINISNKQEVKAIVGGIVGKIEDPNSTQATTIKNCYVKGAINNVAQAGGIVGKITNDTATYGKTTIKNCQVEVTVNNALISGGIVATADGTTGDGIDILNCISTGAITIVKSYVSVGDFDALKAMKYSADTKVFVYVDEEYIEKGIFSETASDVTKFKDDNGDFYSNYYVQPIQEGNVMQIGGLVGSAISTAISNSYANVTISVDYINAYADVGGFIGKSVDGEITSSFAGNNYSKDATKRMDLVVSAQQVNGLTIYGVGGFVGTLNSTTISNCYSTIRVSASDYFAGFVGYIETDSTIQRCYSTGGISQQTAIHKGAFIATDGSTSTTFANCYYENYFGTTMPETIAEKKTLSEILALCNGAEKGSFATIEGYSEPCVIDVVYSDMLKDSVKSGQKLNAELFIAEYNGSTEETTIVNLKDNENIVRIIIGDNTTKGTCLYVIQRKGGLDAYGDDDGSGARIVIYVTIK